jgi:hypothetical protein
MGSGLKQFSPLRGPMRWFMAALWVVFSYPVMAQEHRHPPQDVQLHEKFYSNWYRPDMPSQSCCNKQDCYPTQFKRIGGTWFALRREDQKWIRVPFEKFERNRESPDGQAHVCMQPPGSNDAVFCAVVGEGT